MTKIMHMQINDEYGILIGRENLGKSIYQYLVIVYDAESPENWVSSSFFPYFGRALKEFHRECEARCLLHDIEYKIEHVLYGKPQAPLKD